MQTRGLVAGGPDLPALHTQQKPPGVAVAAYGVWPLPPCGFIYIFGGVDAPYICDSGTTLAENDTAAQIGRYRSCCLHRPHCQLRCSCYFLHCLASLRRGRITSTTSGGLLSATVAFYSSANDVIFAPSLLGLQLLREPKKPWRVPL